MEDLAQPQKVATTPMPGEVINHRSESQDQHVMGWVILSYSGCRRTMREIAPHSIQDTPLVGVQGRTLPQLAQRNFLYLRRSAREKLKKRRICAPSKDRGIQARPVSTGGVGEKRLVPLGRVGNELEEIHQ